MYKLFLHYRIKKQAIEWNELFFFSILLFFWVIMVHISWFLVSFFSNIFTKSQEKICQILMVSSTSCYVMIKWSMCMYLSYRLDIHHLKIVYMHIFQNY